MDRPIVVRISGTSGVIYSVELLRVLRDLGQRTHLILTQAAEQNLEIETPYTPDEVKSLADVVHDIDDMAAALSSGSFPTKGMVVAPAP